MKIVSFNGIMRIRLLLIAFPVLFGLTAFAQDEPPKQQIQQQNAPERLNLFRELGLSPDQIEQMKQLNAERKPELERAVRRMREANRNLDMAIYADDPNEDDVKAKIQEFQQAQAEVVRLRFMSEFAVRKLLTPEQLIKFRDLRRKFAEMRRESQIRGMNVPFRRQFRRMGRPQPPPPNQ